MYKILIAEDDCELQHLFIHVLMKHGYEVIGVCNGEEALQALERDYFDLLICDIMMPRMNGFELAESVRSTDKTTPIIFMTAKGKESFRLAVGFWWRTCV